MTDTFNDFLPEDDDILASILEESLRHYNDVEVPLQSINLNPVPGPSATLDPVPRSSKNLKDVSTTVIDLCESPKKCQTVQSRLSHFFRKPDRDKICDRETDDQNQEKQKNQIEHIDLSSSPEHNESFSSLPAIFYKKPDADGFHLSSGSHYVYPSNFPVREYQMEIIKTALFHNTLVSLPTGLGKTFIAAVVMYNFYRWYPMGKVVFMAPTRPLVAQQIEACYSIMGIPRDVTFEMTGNIPPEQRYLAWKKYRVFFLTPQVLANDLNLGKCPSEMLKCIIVDEAHRATKDYAYVQVLKRLHEENRIIRIVGLSATPGTTVETVAEVIQNLNISRLEFRTDESLDVARYTNKKNIECIPVKLTNAILNVRSQFLVIYDKFSRRLKQYHALSGNVTNLAKFQILGAKQKFLTSNVAREMPKALVGCLINDFTICMSLAYALELLTIYGIKVFYLQSLEICENHKCLSNDADFQKMLTNINKELNCQDLTWSHPKLVELKKIVQDYFGNENTESNSKIIIFCQYRLVVVEVFELLKTFSSSVKPVMFVGQSLKEKGGLPQKKQLEVMSRFKSGDFNVLIATSVAEEGLDIGEVDLIICLEANKSPIKFVQRLGRTGRKRSGKCVTLLTEGKEQMKYNSSVASSKTLVIKMLKNKSILSKLAQGGPRLIPKHINPKCLMIHVKKTEEILPAIKKGKGKKKSEANNIMKHIEMNGAQNQEEEDGLDVFQNCYDKSKRKSKKRKTVELESNDIKEVECPVENNNADLISTDFDFIAEKNDVRVEDERSEVVIDLDYFSEEEKAFNEWLQSCEQTDSVVMNDRFFKLLNLFTDCATSKINGSESEVFKCNIDGEMGNFDTEELFDSQTNAVTCNGDRANTSYANELWRNTGAQLSPATTCSRNRTEDNNVASESVPNRKRVHDECESESDNEDIFKSHRFKGRHDDPTDMKNSIRTSSMACGSFPNTGSAVELGEDERKIDFNALFENSSADVEDDDAGEPQFFRSAGQNLRPDAVGTTVGRDDADVMGSNGSEDDFAVEDVNFEDMFKSQRADRYIEKYNDEIVGERLDDDSDGWTCDDRASPVQMLSRPGGTEDGGTEDGGTEVGGTEDGGRVVRRSADGLNTPPGSARYLEGTSSAGGRPEDAEKTTENVDDDDDAISTDDSLEFFSWRKPTKRDRTEVADSSRAPVMRAVDMSTPPCSQPRVVVDAGKVRDDGPLPSPRGNHDHDDDMDFMFVDYRGDGTTEANAKAPADPPRRADEKPAAETARPYGSGSVPLNILKACNLFKPGISLKMSTASSKRPRPPPDAVVVGPPRTAADHASAARRSVDDMSPINPPNRRHLPPRFSQSTPKVAAARLRPSPGIAAADTVDLLSSSSDSDVFVHEDGGGRDETPTSRRRSNARRRRRRRKPKKKLVFIDDEADVSYFNDSTATAATTAPKISSSDSESSENDNDDDFDSSFIDDDEEKSEPSTSITKQYLRSVKSPTHVRGVFKIPQLTRHHYNMDVYSQAVDRNDHNSYEEDSFCVKDESDLSSNTSAQQTSEKRPCKPLKRKRIVSPQSSDSDSPNQFHMNMMRKRSRAKAALDFS
ncbi:uncharacterized protein LOC112688631 isoform X2 [Sipha flava]|nr:uncharacterized protein LOC112688631 isoform X2 [Sipha flava]XP_025417704.1 uncharacterized protein LOC112688631 isoform X2 [Sipha flava]